MSEKSYREKASEDPFIDFPREKIFIRESGTWFTFGLHKMYLFYKAENIFLKLYEGILHKRI